MLELLAILAPSFTAVSTCVLAWWLKRIDSKAQRAVVLAEPTGNGFADYVRAELGEIRSEQRRQSLDIGGLRGDVRATTSRLDHTIRRLDRHLDH